MDIVKTIVIAIQLLLGLGLIVVISLQSGKSAGLAGAIGGGSETFFGKGKGSTLDKILSKATTIVALIFMVIVIAMYIIVSWQEQRKTGERLRSFSCFFAPAGAFIRSSALPQDPSWLLRGRG